MNKEKKIYSLDDFEDGQVVYLKTRGEVIVEDNQFGGSRGFANGELGYKRYESICIIPELMESHGFFIDRDDYIEWKKEWNDANICKCCYQTKSSTIHVETGKEVYLKRKIYDNE